MESFYQRHDYKKGQQPQKALTTLFRKGTEVGYTETEIDEFLENIDYHALLQAVWNKAETVYAYRADGKNALSFLSI